MQEHGRADIFRYVYERSTSGEWAVVEVTTREVLSSYGSEDQAISAVLSIIEQENVRHEGWAAPASKLDLV